MKRASAIRQVCLGILAAAGHTACVDEQSTSRAVEAGVNVDAASAPVFEVPASAGRPDAGMSSANTASDTARHEWTSGTSDNNSVVALGSTSVVSPGSASDTSPSSPNISSDAGTIHQDTRTRPTSHPPESSSETSSNKAESETTSTTGVNDPVHLDTVVTENNDDSGTSNSVTDDSEASDPGYGTVSLDAGDEAQSAPDADCGAACTPALQCAGYRPICPATETCSRSIAPFKHLDTVVLPDDLLIGGLSFDEAGNLFAGGSVPSADDTLITAWTKGFSATGDETWNGLVEQHASVRAVAVTSDGHRVVAGTFRARHSTNVDAWLGLYDSLGELVWRKQWGSETTDVVDAVIATQDGGFLIGGYSGVPGPAVIPERYDAYVKKFDVSGSELWSAQWGEGDWAGVNALTEDRDGNIYVVGSDSTPEWSQSLVLKLNAVGEIVWREPFDFGPYASLAALTLDGAGGVLIAGSRWSLDEPDGFANHQIVTKLTLQGQVSWTQQWASNDDEGISEVLATPDGKIITLGSRFSCDDVGPCQDDLVLTELDETGNVTGMLIWGTSMSEYPVGLGLDSDGHVLVVANVDGTLSATGRTPSKASLHRFERIAEPVIDHGPRLTCKAKDTLVGPAHHDLGGLALDTALRDVNQDGHPDLLALIDGNLTVELNDARGHFTAPRSTPFAYLASNIVARMALDDFTGDAVPDVAISDWLAGTVNLLRGDGTGRFEQLTSAPVADSWFMNLADLNGDGATDVLVSTISSSIQILINRGDGSVEVGPTVPVNRAQCLLSADLTGDGAMDIVACRHKPDDPSTMEVVLMENLAGQFTEKLVLTQSSDTTSLVHADMNDDGSNDLVIADRTGHIQVLMNDGSGTEWSTIAYATDISTTAIAMADLNQDGLPDAAITNEAGYTLHTFVNTGDGHFEMGPEYPGLQFASGLQTGDVDGNGTTDLAVIAQRYPDVLILKSGSDGSFDTTHNYRTGQEPSLVAAADLDADGLVDLALGTANGVSVLLNTGAGYASPIVSPAPPWATSVTAVDLNADQLPELISADGVRINVLTNIDGGWFWNSGLYPESGAFDAKARDINNDGWIDIVFASTSGVVGVYLGEPCERFSDPAFYPVGHRLISLDLADFNFDGRLDVVTADQEGGGVYVLLNRGDEQFAPPQYYETGDEALSVVATDLDGDHAHDVAVINRRDKNLSVLINDGSGQFMRARSYSVGSWPQYITAADIDGDGAIDLAVTSTEFNVTLLPNDGTGVFSQRVEFGAGGAPQGLVATDLNADGAPDLAVANWANDTVSVLLNRCVP